MKKRTFKFDSSSGAGDILSNVLQHYASVAFPMGGSDCAATSRQALLELSAKLVGENNEADTVEISTRQRPILKSALTWFYEETVLKNNDDEVLDKVMYDHILLNYNVDNLRYLFAVPFLKASLCLDI